MTSRTVLVVGDPGVERERTCAAVAELGYEPVAADGCEQCLDLLEGLQPVAVIADLWMSTVRGDECCRRIKESSVTRAVPVLLATRSGLPHELMQIWRAAAEDLLVQPVNAARLGAKLEVLSRADPALPEGTGSKESLVLLADPSRFFRRLLGENLQHSGMQVLHALDGDEALDLAKEHAQQLDACVVDLGLAGTSGVEVVETLAGLPALQGKPLVVFAVEKPPEDVVEKVRTLTGAEPLPKREQPFDDLLSRVRGTPLVDGIDLRASERKPFFASIEFSTDQQTWSTGFTYDVSAGALFVRTLTPAPAGSPVRIRARFPGASESCVSSGVVAWSNPYDPCRTFAAPAGMAVHLTDIAPQLRNQISGLVAQDAIPPPPPAFAELRTHP